MRSSYVYVITNEDENVCKIGISDNPLSRRAQLQIGNPQFLTLCFAAQARADFIYKLEQILHQALDTKRQSGEWFSVSPEIAASLVSTTSIFLRDFFCKHGSYPQSYADLKKHHFSDSKNFPCAGIRGFSSKELSEIKSVRLNF